MAVAVKTASNAIFVVLLSWFKPNDGWIIQPISLLIKTSINTSKELKMMIQYYDAPDIRKRIEDIIEILRFDHINIKNLHCVRSRGSNSKRTIARIHGIGRIWQEALGMEPTYIIEVIHEQFDFYPKSSQDRTLIHELLHVPHSAKGGFRHHKTHVNHENVDIWYNRYTQKCKEMTARKV